MHAGGQRRMHALRQPLADLNPSRNHQKLGVTEQNLSRKNALVLLIFYCIVRNVPCSVCPTPRSNRPTRTCTRSSLGPCPPPPRTCDTSSPSSARTLPWWLSSFCYVVLLTVTILIINFAALSNNNKINNNSSVQQIRLLIDIWHLLIDHLTIYRM